MRLTNAGVLALAMFFTGPVEAADLSPVGQWTVRFWLEPLDRAGARQGLCFKADGTFYSTTFESWHGTWVRKGDRIRFAGTTDLAEVTAAFGQLATPNVGGGEFFNNITFAAPFLSGNFAMAKVGAVCGPPAAGAAGRGRSTAGG